MLRAKHVLAACVLTIAAPARAATHIVDIAWDGEGRFTHGANVAPGKFVEVCGKLRPGEAVRWSFDASAALDFNIHYHLGKHTEFPARQEQVRSGHDTLRVAVPEDHCWMWHNKSTSPVRIDVRLQR